MNKEEAFVLAQHRSKLVIGYIEKILSNGEKVEGNMQFSSYKIDGQNMCTLSILVKEINLEKHINLGITSEHCDILYEQLFKDFLSTFLEHENIGVSRYYSIKYSMTENFTGINAENSNGGKIKINFLCKEPKFDEIVTNYNKTIQDYINKNNFIDEPSVGSR